MPSLTSFVRSLGNDRAVANAQRSLLEREREDWLVAGLVHRVEARDRALAAPAAEAMTAAADASSAVHAAA